MTAQVLSPTTKSAAGTNTPNAPDAATTTGGKATTTTTTTPAMMNYRNNSTDILPLRVTVTDPDYKDQMKKVVKALCPFLKRYDNDSLSIQPLGGGLSNELFIVSVINNNSSKNNGDKEVKDDDIVAVERETTTNQDDDDNNEEKKEEQQENESQQQSSSVLVRIHPTASTSTSGADGQQLPSIVDRDIENAISAWLSSQNVGPIYYGRFVNGRVEEFYPQHSTLSWQDMPKFGPSHIASIMAQFHSLQVPAHVMERQSQSSKDEGDIFFRVREWMALAEQLCQQSSSSSVQKDSNSSNNKENEKAAASRATVLLEQLKQDWMWLEKELLRRKEEGPTRTAAASDTTPPSSPQLVAQTFLNEIVFTHMDMQSLNLLKDMSNTKEDIIKVIDFEYAGFNPRAIDMANTFCEHCDMNNIKADYNQEYPTTEIQNAFLQSYIRNLLLLPATSATTTTTTTPNNEDNQQTTAAAADLGGAVGEEEQQQQLLERYLDDPIFLETARTIIGRYSLVSHLSWAIWSIVQSFMSDIDFDYIHYANHRLDGFLFGKAKFF